jgi:hypothetical protein
MTESGKRKPKSTGPSASLRAGRDTCAGKRAAYPSLEALGVKSGSYDGGTGPPEGGRYQEKSKRVGAGL